MVGEREPLDKRVYNHLLAQLSTHQFELGSQLKPGKLATNLNVSRTTVRKALSRLIDDGWVKQTQSGQTVVAECPKGTDAPLGETLAEVELQSQIESTYWMIFDWILQGNCQFSADVNPRIFVDYCGASMGTIRHALDGLTRDGILVRAPRRGWRYGTLTWQDVIDTIEIRTMFESEVLRRAGQRIPHTILEQLKAETESILESIDSVSERDRRQADYHFHTTLVEQTTSLVLIDLVKPLIRRSMYCSLTSPSNRRHQANSFREHLGIIESLAKGDLTKAIDLFQAHMSRSLMDGLRTKLPNLNSKEGILSSLEETVSIPSVKSTSAIGLGRNHESNAEDPSPRLSPQGRGEE